LLELESHRANLEGRAPSRPTLFLEGAIVGRASGVNDGVYKVA